MNLQYLIKYKSFISVEDMDAAVQAHVNAHYDQLTESAKAVLHCLASHSLTAYGASHLMATTIAKEVGISVQTVYRATKKLTELGIITKHKTVKKTGQGASIYVIAPKINTRNDSHVMRSSCQSLETHVKPTAARDSRGKNEPVTKNLITTSFNPFVVKNVVNNVNALAHDNDLKQSLRAIYSPSTVEGNQAFEELCKIAFGRLKQYMRSHNVPYLQLEQIVLKAMNDLVRKQNVKNQFAMYSAMIKRQTEQLFVQPVKPVQAFKQPSREIVPDWFEKRNEPSTVERDAFDFEAERQKILAKLG